jgi:hypothetical protein
MGFAVAVYCLTTGRTIGCDGFSIIGSVKKLCPRAIFLLPRHHFIIMIEIWGVFRDLQTSQKPVASGQIPNQFAIKIRIRSGTIGVERARFMFIKFIKILCMSLWLAGFVLLGMSYATFSETHGLSDQTVKKNDSAVSKNVKQAQLQAIGGVSAILTGALLGLLTTLWGNKYRRRRDRSRVSSNADHLAMQYRRPSRRRQSS